jgi:hypothetical protein
MLPTKKECKEAINKMKNNKSPGQDGLTVAFYKLFWHDIKEMFYASLLQSIDDGMLSFSQRNAVKSLIYKKGEKENLKKKPNKIYRPISLTNVDYKIFANISVGLATINWLTAFKPVNRLQISLPVIRLIYFILFLFQTFFLFHYQRYG